MIALDATHGINNVIEHHKNDAQKPHTSASCWLHAREHIPLGPLGEGGKHLNDSVFKDISPIFDPPLKRV